MSLCFKKTASQKAPLKNTISIPFLLNTPPHQSPYCRMLTTLKNCVKPSVDYCFSLLGYRHCLTSDFTIDSTPRSNVLSLIESLYPVGVGSPLIRLGPKNGDGGYLIPDDLEGITACFSPGVSNVSGFEKDCAELGMRVFMADHSVNAPAEHHENFHFIKKFVGGTTFGKYITLDDWVRETLPNGASDLMLQMDIEGQEYETLFSISDKLMRRFRISSKPALQIQVPNKGLRITTPSKF